MNEVLTPEQKAQRLAAYRATQTAAAPQRIDRPRTTFNERPVPLPIQENT